MVLLEVDTWLCKRDKWVDEGLELLLCGPYNCFPFNVFVTYEVLLYMGSYILSNAAAQVIFSTKGILVKVNVELIEVVSCWEVQSSNAHI